MTSSWLIVGNKLKLSDVWKALHFMRKDSANLLAVHAMNSTFFSSLL